MLDEDPVFGPEDVRGDPVGRRPKSREAAVHDDEIAVGHDHPGLVLERRGEAPDEGEQALAAGRDVGAVLDVAGRPKPLCRGVVAPVEERVEGLQHHCLVPFLCRLVHCCGPPSLLVQAKCQVSRSPSRETRPTEDSAKWVEKTSALVSAAWFIAHRRDIRAASGNSQKPEFQSGLTNCSGWCITSPQNSACSPRELKRMQAWSIV